MGIFLKHALQVNVEIQKYVSIVALLIKFHTWEVKFYSGGSKMITWAISGGSKGI